MSFLEEIGFFRYEAIPEYQDAQNSPLALARVVAQQRGLVRIRGRSQGHDGEWWAELSGHLKHEATEVDRPVVGDFVQATPGREGDRVLIQRILPRQNLLQRLDASGKGSVQPMAANIDRIWIVTSANEEFNPRRLERYRMLADQCGLSPELILSKADLVDQDSRSAFVGRVPAGFLTQWVSAESGEGMVDLRSSLERGQTVVLVGSSGVGKSTIMNALLEENRQKTREISLSDSKGRHTTTARSLLPLPGGALLVDTPGIRGLALVPDRDSLGNTFADISDLASRCRFRDCAHRVEPGCAVLEALASGQLDPDVMKSFEKLRREQAYQSRRVDSSAAREEKAKWKAIHKALRKSESR